MRAKSTFQNATAYHPLGDLLSSGLRKSPAQVDFDQNCHVSDRKWRLKGVFRLRMDHIPGIFMRFSVHNHKSYEEEGPIESCTVHDFIGDIYAK